MSHDLTILRGWKVSPTEFVTLWYPEEFKEYISDLEGDESAYAFVATITLATFIEKRIVELIDDHKEQPYHIKWLKTVLNMSGFKTWWHQRRKIYVHEFADIHDIAHCDGRDNDIFVGRDLHKIKLEELKFFPRLQAQEYYSLSDEPLEEDFYQAMFPGELRDTPLVDIPLDPKIWVIKGGCCLGCT